MTTTAAPQEPQVGSLVAPEVEAFLANVNRQAARDRNADAIAELEASWRIS